MNVAYRELESSGSPAFEFHTGEDYFDTLSADIDSQDAGFISVSTMNFNPDEPKVEKVIESIRAAADRGLDTSITVDNFASLDKTKVGLIGTAYAGNDQVLDGLSRDGVMIRNSNYPRIGKFNHIFPSNVYTGRSHIKSAVVNDRLYLGGISLDATDRLDAMVSFTNPQLAANVLVLSRTAVVSSVRYILSDKDHVISFDDETDAKLIVDAGVKGQSAVFDEALSIVDEAQESLVYASEQFPNGKIGKHLLRAYERGVDVKIAVNHPNSHDRYRFVHSAILTAAKKKYPSEFFAYQLSEDAPTLHTKAIASERRAMIGSHNLNTIGVNLGTAEMDVASSDPDFVKQTADLVMNQIQENVDVK